MPWWCWGCLAALGGAVGAWRLELLIDRERRMLELPPTSPQVRRIRPLLVCLSIVALSLGLAWAELVAGCLSTPEVQPSPWGAQLRLGYHLILVGLLVAATFIDFDCYLLPDEITLRGLAIGVGGALLVQDLQIAHLWVDWAYAIPQLRGPHIPAWYDQWRWLHALVWTLAGAVAGGAVTQMVRWLSSRILGQEAMGFGDVTFMVMIGSFLGWQAVLLIFAIAPLTGILFAMIGKVVFNRPYLPYGPCLAAAALIVLFNWSTLWERTRLIFSDLVGLGMVAMAATVALALLLLVIRGYRAIPTRA